jgi:hypothetical protein
MTRHLIRALTLSICAASAACSEPPTAPTARALGAFVPFLHAGLTPASTQSTFGAPDERQGSGLIIYVYRLTDGRRLQLGFPGEAPITYAKVVNPDATVTDLALPSRPASD